MTSPDSTTGSSSVAARGGREAVISRELLDLALEDPAWQEGLDRLEVLVAAAYCPHVATGSKRKRSSREVRKRG